MTMNPLRFSWIASAALLLAVGATDPSRAASLTVDPITVEADAKAGEDFTGVINVDLVNAPGETSTESQRIKVAVKDWDMKPNGTLVYDKPGTFPGSCAAWIEVNPAEYELAPGKRVELRYTVRIPKDTPSGTYRAVLFNQTHSMPVPGKKGLSVASAVGTIVYLTVGPRSRKGQIVGFSVTPTGTRILIENQGTEHLRVTGTLQIQDPAGKLLGEMKLSGTVILPGANGEKRRREIVAEFPPEMQLAPGQYRLQVVLDYRGEALIGARKLLTVPDPAATPPAAPPVASGQAVSVQ